MEIAASASFQSIPSYNVQKVRNDFPIFRESIHGKPLVYLDNASMTQKPQSVIDALVHFYSRECSNIHRGIHYLSERATESYENSRSKVRRFINAVSDHEIIFVRGSTEGINLVAQTYGRMNIGPGDEIIITAMEHHSNIVPWQMLCHERSANLRVAPINLKGELILEEFERLLCEKTRLVATTYVSNALGTINPVRQIIELAHKFNAPVLVDGAQAVQHMPIDVQALDCDFLVFSGHKMYGPTGIGILYGKERLLETMPPYQGGGDMVQSVSFDKTIFQELPYKFEAGTAHISGAIGLGSAIDYLGSMGLNNIAAHEFDIFNYCNLSLNVLDDLRIIGSAREKSGVISFTLGAIHPHDIGAILDYDGIAIRAGHHCAQPAMDFFRIPATARVSFGLYNSREDVDILLHGLKKAKEVFK